LQFGEPTGSSFVPSTATSSSGNGRGDGDGGDAAVTAGADSCPHLSVTTHNDGSRSCSLCGVVLVGAPVVSLCRDSQCDEADDATCRADAWLPRTGREVATSGVETAKEAHRRHVRATCTSLPRRVSWSVGSAVSRVQKEAVESSRAHEELTSKGEAFNRALQKLVDQHLQAARASRRLQRTARLATFDVVRKTEVHRGACKASKCSREWRFARMGTKQLAVAIADVVATDSPTTHCTERLAEHLKTVTSGGTAHFRSCLRHVLEASMDDVRRPCEEREHRTPREKRAIARLSVCVNRLHATSSTAYEETHRAYTLLADDVVASRCLDALSASVPRGVVAAALVVAMKESRADLLRSAVAAHAGLAVDVWKLVLDLRVAASQVASVGATCQAPVAGEAAGRVEGGWGADDMI
jgi:hypothetical protein